jgi:hypothetical protein
MDFFFVCVWRTGLHSHWTPAPRPAKAPRIRSIRELIIGESQLILCHCPRRCTFVHLRTKVNPVMGSHCTWLVP